MKQSNDTQRRWGIFYKAPNGEIYPCITHLGLVQLSEDSVNIYCDESKREEIFQQTIAYVTREKRPETADAGNAYWEGCLKPEYRNGTVFISRVGSKDFPVTLLEDKPCQTDFDSKGKAFGPPLWALRVPCKLKA